MSQPDPRESIGILGGTGPQGRGLAARWAISGHPVHVGSRRREKAEDVVGSLREELGDRIRGSLHPAENREACEQADIIVIAVPYDAQRPTLTELRETIGGKLVVNVVNPMTFDEVGPKAVPVEAGSAAEECQELLPEATVVSAFHDVPARRLQHVDDPVECDVLICGDDHAATHRVAHLAAEIPGMWGVYCGPLRNSRHIENMTPVLLFINRYYKVHSGIKIDGIEHDDSALHAHKAEGAARGGRKAAG